MTKQTNDTRIMLFIPPSFKADYSYTGIQAFKFDFVTMDVTGKVRNPSYEHECWANLQFRAQVSHQEGEQPYGYSLAYSQVYSVELREAERMVKMLKKAEKADERFPVRPTSYGQYVQLMCSGLGVHGAVTPMTGNGRGYDDDTYQTWKLTEIQWLVDRRISEFLETNREHMRAAARY